MQDAIKDSRLSQNSGVKGPCPLTKYLEQFHVVEGYPPDILHDVLEEIVPVEVSLCLTDLIAKKYFTLDTLNEVIRSFLITHLQTRLISLRKSANNFQPKGPWLEKFNWTELSVIELNWSGLNFTEVSWTDCHWTKMNQTELNQTEQNGTGCHWTELRMTGQKWNEIHQTELMVIELYSKVCKSHCITECFCCVPEEELTPSAGDNIWLLG